MCGIFGQCCLGQYSERFATLLSGLSALQYRGYDSCGIAWTGQTDEKINVLKAIGAIDALESIIAEKSKSEAFLQPQDNKCWCAIAHTRWATHGNVSVENTHPHCAGGYTIVHNGVVDNADQLRNFLVEKYGVQLKSQTDTELIVQLIALQPLKQSLVSRVASALQEIQGANSIALLSEHDPDQVLLWRRGSPLIVGLCDDSQQPRYISLSKSTALPSRQMARAENDEPLCFTFASDIAALQGYAQRALLLSDNDIAILDARQGTCCVFYRGTQPQSTVEPLLPSDGDVDGDQLLDRQQHISIASIHENYNDGLCMWRELHEQPSSLRRATIGRLKEVAYNNGEKRFEVLLGGLEDHWHAIETAQRFVMIGCGTSYHAALASRPLLERLCRKQVLVERATPFMDRGMPIFRGDACFFLSQSGETADTLAALKYCKENGALCIGIVNTVASSIARLTDCGLYLKCGPEIGVASTKSYTSQICVLGLIAAKLCTNDAEKQHLLKSLQRLPETVEQALTDSKDWCRQLAVEWKEKQRCILLARGSDEATCYEAALKIKELCYVLAEGCHAGELKHGPLALIDDCLPIIAFGGDESTDPSDLVQKMSTAIEQVIARNGRPKVIVSGPQTNPKWTTVDSCLVLPSVGHELLQCVVNIIPMQLLSFYWATERNLNVDRPRNLAKSVTVH